MQSKLLFLLLLTFAWVSATGQENEVEETDLSIGTDTPLGKLHIAEPEIEPIKTSGFIPVNYPFIVFQRDPLANLGNTEPRFWSISDDYGYLNFWKGKPGSGTEVNLLGLDEELSILSSGLDIQGGRVWTGASWRESLRLGNSGAIQFDINANFKFGIGANDYDRNLCFFTAGGGERDQPDYKMILTSRGSLVIGATDPKGYKLAVAGKMIAEEVVVKLEKRWPDYVFARGYVPTSLEDVKTAIQQDGHLPGMPNEEEIQEKGLSVGEMTMLQQEKIEEIYLHLIRMNDELEALKEKNAVLERQNEALRKQLNRDGADN